MESLTLGTCLARTFSPEHALKVEKPSLAPAPSELGGSSQQRDREHPGGGPQRPWEALSLSVPWFSCLDNGSNNGANLSGPSEGSMETKQRPVHTHQSCEYVLTAALQTGEIPNAFARGNG